MTTPTLNNPALSGCNNQTNSNQYKSNTGKPFLFVDFQNFAYLLGCYFVGSCLAALR